MVIDTVVMEIGSYLDIALELSCIVASRLAYEIGQ